MVKFRAITLLIVSSVIGTGNIICADNNQQQSIVEHITTDTNNTITQPDSLKQRLLPDTTATHTTTRMGGYRIQVFSDNNSRTAKNEARTKARNISAAFPQYRTYVTYNSPYWRLKVGDFRTQQEATEVADAIKEAFPSYKREIRIVRDRINITE